MPRKALLSPDRLRVVHGGRDELVEIDVLDVEGLAHMRAARTQQRRHLGLVRLPLELGRNRLRRRRHLTERKRSRKDLDQERFHRGGPAERDEAELSHKPLSVTRACANDIVNGDAIKSCCIPAK